MPEGRLRPRELAPIDEFGLSALPGDRRGSGSATAFETKNAGNEARQRTKMRSNIRAVWHLDEFVAQNARAIRHVHLSPADLAVRRILIVEDGFLVCNNFIESPALGAFKGLSHRMNISRPRLGF